MNQNETQNIIKGIIDKIPLQTDEVSFSCEGDNQVLWCQIKTKESNLFIGRDGEILGALNHLARKLVEKYFYDQIRSEASGANRSLASVPKIIIDVNNFQKNKIENLKTLAHMLSERAKFFKSNIETDPMTAYDRKVIHEFLVGKQNIKTESTGVDPWRRVVIKYTE